MPNVGARDRCPPVPRLGGEPVRLGVELASQQSGSGTPVAAVLAPVAPVVASVLATVAAVIAAIRAAVMTPDGAE